jgi:hypothetical protein
MRYPKHLILDLRTPETSTSAADWKQNFLTKTPLLLDNETSLYVNVVKNSSANLHSAQEHKSESFYSSTTTTFDINFLRKEKLYTKLKYSRCPQYDIVSGGFAAILAGFIGFLISEKFGIELVDSGDFYFAFMYGVIGSFSLRPLVRIYSKDNTPYTPFSLKYVLIFSRDLTLLVFAEIKF